MPGNFKLDVAAWLIAFALLLGVLLLHLVPALFTGLIAFTLIHSLAPVVSRLAQGVRGRLLVAILLVAVVVGLFVALGIATAAFVRSEAGLSALFARMALIIEDASQTLPPWLADNLPNSGDEIRSMSVDWLRAHSTEMRIFGTEAGMAFVHGLIGLVIGVMVAVHDVLLDTHIKPLSAALMRRMRLFTYSFRQVVFAQIRISAINTAFTAIYLAIILPACGVHLPLVKTMILVSFIVGLLPVIGNLISNTVIIVVSLSHSLQIAAGSLLFLVLIHKLEYFLNAKIVGGRIRASAWEILLAMLLMEALFGIGGLAAAPVFYAYLKSELSARGLV
ncbi:membrane protein [Silvimonas sp. JCM 19000]